MIMPAAQPTAPSQSLPQLNEENFASHTAATKVGPAPAPPVAFTPPINELEDLLYDLLAAGGDLSVNGSKLELIQAFLHEHARQRKSQEQFVAFFEEHGLSMRPERPNLFALPHVDSSTRAAARTPLLLPDAPPAAPVERIVVESRSRFGWIWAALGVAAIAGSLALGASAVVVMRTELDRMNASVAHTETELEQMRAEIKRLSAIVESNSAAVQNAERDTRLLLQTFAPPIAQNSR
jgi:hypothetical protein